MKEKEMIKLEIGAILEQVNMGDGYADINNIADRLYHIVIPEGSVVLTEMQYNALLSKQSTVISIDEQLKKEFEYELKQARKETAKEIFKKLKELINDVDHVVDKCEWGSWKPDVGYDKQQVDDGLKELVKAFAVEVEE